MNTMWAVLIGFIPTLISSFGVYFIMRRKLKVETKGNELDNIQRAVNIWRDLAHGLEEKIKYLQEKMEALETAQRKKCEFCKYRIHFHKSQEKDA